jgi:hypothetical protein
MATRRPGKEKRKQLFCWPPWHMMPWPCRRATAVKGTSVFRGAVGSPLEQAIGEGEGTEAALVGLDVFGHGRGLLDHARVEG